MFKHIRTMANPNWNIEALYQGRPTLQKTAAVDDGIMAQKNTNRDNDDADAGKSNDTPRRMQRNANAADEITKGMETERPIHARTCNRATEGNEE